MPAAGEDKILLICKNTSFQVTMLFGFWNTWSTEKLFVYWTLGILETII